MRVCINVVLAGFVAINFAGCGEKHREPVSDYTAPVPIAPDRVMLVIKCNGECWMEVNREGVARAKFSEHDNSWKLEKDNAATIWRLAEKTLSSDTKDGYYVR